MMHETAHYGRRRMRSRGQESFVNLPDIAARLYDSLTQTKAIEHQYREIAQDLISRIERGRMLDIGTGPGKLLFEVHQLNPDIELFGFDISGAMVQLARKKLKGIKVNIECGDIRQTNYEDDFFDIITCTGSFYLWDNPEEGLEEIYRIIKKNRSAYLYETYQDINLTQVQEAIKNNLVGESWFRKLLTPVFLLRQLRMTYRKVEIIDVIKRTSFMERFTIDQISLGGLPAWLRIQLTKSS